MDTMLGRERAGVVGGSHTEAVKHFGLEVSSITSIITSICHGTLLRTSLIMKTLEYMWM